MKSRSCRTGFLSEGSRKGSVFFSRFFPPYRSLWAFFVAQMVKNLPAMQDTQV